MNRYRFEISVNEFILYVHYAVHEDSGLKWCREYCSKFQSKVANLKITVKIYEREKQKENWMYHDQPYIYKKTMIKKPRGNKDCQ